MTPERWHRLTTVFHAALARRPESRERFIDDACEGDASLAADARSMLLAHRQHTTENSGGVGRPPVHDDLAPGTELGVYRIDALIGGGGQARVYRATDTQIGKTVAIKILPDGWLDDPGRRARFDREARVLAALDEPHIAAIYGLVSDGRRRGLVLEYVDGECLSDLIDREAARGGGVPLNRALTIARDVAAALEAAHDKGIVHRDLKPANVKIAASGRIKVLDFGLARLESDAAVDMPPGSTIEGTREGLVMGTPAYMSPEQARGQAADRRTDVWAFGCVLVEMLTGRPMFARETLSDTLAAVIEQPIDLAVLPAATPPAVRDLLRRCLQRDLRQRQRDIGDVRLVLDDVLAAPDAPVAPHISGPPARRAIAAIAGVAALVVAALLIGRFAWQPEGLSAPGWGDSPGTTLALDLGDVSREAPPDFAVSADGERLVYRGDQSLILRRLDAAVATPIPNTAGAGPYFFLSPDGKDVAFTSGGKLKRVPVDGGVAQEICAASALRGGTWGEDGFIVAALGVTEGLSRVPETGGVPVPLTRLGGGEFTHRFPHRVQRGAAVVFTSHTQPTGFDNGNVEIISVTTGQRRVLHERAIAGPFIDSETGGFFTYLRQGKLFAQELDLTSLTPRGRAVEIADGISYEGILGFVRITASRKGTMIYGRQIRRQLQWLDNGKPVADAARFPPDAYEWPVVSKTGRVAYVLGSDLHTAASDGSDRHRLTTSEDLGAVLWSGDGTYLIFARIGQGLWWTRADGSAPPQPLVQPGSRMLGPNSFNAAGVLAFSQIEQGDGGTAQWDLWTMPTATDAAGLRRAGAPALWLYTTEDERTMMFSPDGGWVTYQSTVDAVGTFQIFARRYPFNERSWQISTSPGQSPKWSPDGKKIYWAAGNRIMVTDFAEQDGAVRRSEPRQWSDVTLVGLLDSFAVAPDGRILALTAFSADVDRARVLAVMTNVPAEIRRQLQPRR